MADVHDRKTRSYNMSKIKGKDTKPEEMVRKYLFSKGLRYRKNDKRQPIFVPHPQPYLTRYTLYLKQIHPIQRVGWIEKHPNPTAPCNIPIPFLSFPSMLPLGNMTSRRLHAKVMKNRTWKSFWWRPPTPPQFLSFYPAMSGIILTNVDRSCLRRAFVVPSFFLRFCLPS